MAAKQQSRTSIDTEALEETLTVLVDKLAAKIGNGGTKLDERLTNIERIQQESREATVIVKEKVQNLHMVVMEDIKPSIKRLDDQIKQVELGIGKPCPFHEMTSQQLSKLGDLELKCAELQQRHNSLVEQIRSNDKRAVSDINNLGERVMSELGLVKTDVEGVKKDVGQIKTSLEVVRESGTDTKEWTKYIVTGIVSVVFSVLTFGVIQLIQHFIGK